MKNYIVHIVDEGGPDQWCMCDSTAELMAINSNFENDNRVKIYIFDTLDECGIHLKDLLDD